MQGYKWLSETIDESLLQYGKLNLITAYTGCGKTTWAADYLSKKVNNKNKMVYLIDTTVARDQLLQDETKFAEYDPLWRHCVTNDIIDFVDDRIVVITFAKFGALVTYFPDVLQHFEVIICDEIHSLIKFENINASEKEENYITAAIEAITTVIKEGKTLVVGLSATPSKVYKRFKCAKNLFPKDDALRRYEEKKVVHYASPYSILGEIEQERRGLLFVTRITQVKDIVDYANKIGWRAIGLWSKNADGEKKMNDEQNRVRKWIIERREFPPEYNLVVMNAAYETSITIGGKVDFIIVHKNDPDSIIQARGRVRGDLDALYLLDVENGKILVPRRYLDRPLSREEREELAAVLNLAGGLKWTGIKKRLEEAGYSIEEGPRKHNKRFYIIRSEN